VPSDQAVVFINERFENVGKISKGDLLPGEYRVYVQIGKQNSRLHRVVVRADQESKLTIDARFDDALATPATWAGFVFKTAADRENLETRYAARVAQEIGASAVVVVGIDQVRGRSALVGSVVDLRTAREIRRASVAIDPMPGAERMRALARFLAGDQAASGLDVEIGARTTAVRTTSDNDDPSAAQPETEGPRTSNRRWMRWTGITAIALGLGGGGLAYKFVGDANAKGDEIDRVCAVSCTPDQVRTLQDAQSAANRNAVIAGVAGGALVVTGVVFVLVSRSSSSSPATSVSIAPTRGGVAFSYGTSF